MVAAMSVSVNRRSFLRLSVGVASVSLLAACGGGAAPASTAPSSAPAAASTPAAPASASAKPAASSAASASASAAAPASGKPAASPSTAVSAAPGTQLVRIATVGSISDAGFYLADDRGYMKE